LESVHVSTTVAPRTAPNQPPILTGGTTLDGVEGAVAGLTAEGNDPDGDPVTYKWDWGECAIAESWERNTADVRLKDGCVSATVVLTWTDSKGASTSTEWYLSR
jgi:cytochrome c